MLKRVCLLLVSLLVFNLVGGSVVFAKDKDFMPPGLEKKAKSGKMLPPPFQNLQSTEWGKLENSGNGDLEQFREFIRECLRYRSNYNIPDLFAKNTFTGEIINIEEIGDQDWIVVKSDVSLKTFKLEEDSDKYFVGDLVKIEYTFENLLNIQLIETEDEDKDAGKLTFALTVSPKVVEVDEKISFNLQIKNATDQDIERQFTSGQLYDFVVKKDGKTVWQWSDDKNFITVIQKIIFEQGEEENYSVSWEPENTGSYIVEAFFMGESRSKPVVTEEFYVVKY